MVPSGTWRGARNDGRRKVLSGMKMSIRYLLAVALGCVAQGHDLYVMPSSFAPSPGQAVVVGFHVGDSFPQSEVLGRLSGLVAPRLLSAQASNALQNIRTEGNRNVADGVVSGRGELVAAVSTAPALINLEPGKFKEYLVEEGLTEIVQWREAHGETAKNGKERYSKYAKAILISGESDSFGTKPVGFVIEIIPEIDVYALKLGDSLPVRVLFRGKPAAGLQVESSWAADGKNRTTVIGRTGTDGRIRIPLQEAGVWRIHTIKMERCREPQAADWESFWSSMTFELR